MEVGAGSHRYEVIEDWLKLPAGFEWGQVVQVIVDGQDRVYYFHRGKPGVMIFDQSGAQLGSWPEDGRFQDIHSAWLGNDSDGEYLLIVDRDRNALARTTLDGEKVWEVVSDRFSRPTDAAAASNGDIYMSDGYGNPYVHRLSATGEHIATWGTAGVGPGQYRLPHGVWFAQHDGQERVYVCDRENRRIQVLTLDGEYVTKLTDLRRPTDIITGPDGARYISELMHRVTILDANDRLIAHIGGEPKAEPGEFVAPHSVALDSQGSLYVTEVLEGRRVQKFRRL
jgi:sugar lactone lactonase YvrE